MADSAYSGVFAPDSLDGKVVLITGGSRGIGASIARIAARCGAEVAIGYEQDAEAADAVVSEIAAAGGRAAAYRADIADEQQVEQMVAAVEAEFGGIDGLVNNAGIMPQTPFLDMSVEEWRRVIDVDVTGAFLCIRSVLGGMVERGSGAIVNISSRLGQIGFAGVVHYSTAKAGLLGLTKALAREFGPKGVRVNAVAPGVTLTEMAGDVTQGDVGARRLAELPAGRFAEPHEVAESVVFLLSDAAALYHGQTLNPNGGGFMQ